MVRKCSPQTAATATSTSSFFFSSRRRHTRSVSAFLLNRSSDLRRRKRASKITCRRSDVMSKGKKRSGARPGRPQPLRGTKANGKAVRFWIEGVNNFNFKGFRPLLEDKLCLIFKLAPSVCRMTFPILASLLVRLVVLLPFQLLRLSLATPSRWTPLALSVFLHCVVALLLTLL